VSLNLERRIPYVAQKVSTWRVMSHGAREQEAGG